MGSLVSGHYSEAFLRYQKQPEKYPDTFSFQKTSCRNNTIWRWFGLCLMFIFLPIFLASAIASHYADARNTVSFFKIFAGGLAGLIWIPLLVVFAALWPSFIIPRLVSAFIGYKVIQHKGSALC